jgi:magnesium-transporting ATPase (P-type)
MTLYTAKLFPSGLSQEEAQYRLRKNGPNALPPSRSSGLWHVLLDLNREPIFLLLFAASAIYFFLGEASDALLLLSFVLVALGIVISRQRQTEHVLDIFPRISALCFSNAGTGRPFVNASTTILSVALCSNTIVLSSTSCPMKYL